MPSPLWKQLLEALEIDEPEYAHVHELSARLEGLLERGRAAAPGVAVPDATFIAYLAARLDRQKPPVRALEEAQVEALYLCCACAAGDEAALRLIEERHFEKVRATIARIDPTLLDETQQTMRERLFVSEGGAPRRIETYSGRGQLGAWLCAIAARTALELREKSSDLAAPREGDDELSALPEHRDNAEIQYLKARYRGAYRDAFSAALRTLSPRDRALLRLHFGSGLSLERIGQLYQTHKSTISRWLAQTRADLLQAVRRELQSRLAIKEDELDSLTAQVRSQVDITLTSIWSKDD